MKSCPVDPCRQLIEDSALVCSWHWKRLPGEARRELSNLHHNVPGSPADRIAIAAALAYLAERQPQGAHA